MLGIFYTDERSKEVFKNLEKDHEVELIERFDEVVTMYDKLLLPMSGINEFGEVKMKGEMVKVPEEFWNHCSLDCTIFTGKECNYLLRLPFKVVNLSNNENFMIHNARLTAEGVLFLLIDNTSLGLKDISVDLLGFGNCGREIYHLLKALDVQVRVIRRQVEHESSEFMSYLTWQQLKCHDVIINTSITNWMNESWMLNWANPPLIINIVSDLHLSESVIHRLGGRVVNAGPLPSIIAHKSAAMILTKALCEEMNHGE